VNTHVWSTGFAAFAGANGPEILWVSVTVSGVVAQLVTEFLIVSRGAFCALRRGVALRFNVAQGTAPPVFDATVTLAADVTEGNATTAAATVSTNRHADRIIRTTAIGHTSQVRSARASRCHRNFAKEWAIASVKRWRADVDPLLDETFGIGM
jgi:hypothetical protein